MEKTKIVVTGGSGFIGTNLIDDLISKGHEVINIDIARPQKNEHISTWRKIDIRDLESLKKCLVDFLPDYIVHLAARTDLEGKTLQEYDSNISGTFNVIKAIEQLQSVKKIIVTSSMLVCKSGYQPRNMFDYNPSTLYGESKVLTEKTVWENHPQCDWAIIRPTSIWGPWFDVPYRNFFDMVINRRYFHVGNKSCTKTYGYVGNAVYQIEKILFSNTTKDAEKVFYIGDYEPTNIEDWANQIAMQLEYTIIKVPFWSIRCAAFVGDLLKHVKISFPMTSFRLKNMTTDNIVDMSLTHKYAKSLPYSRQEGIVETLKWLGVH